MKGEGTSLYTLRSQSWYKLVNDHGQLVTNQLVYNAPTVAEWMLNILLSCLGTCEMKVMVVSIVSVKILILRRCTLYMENGMLSRKLYKYKDFDLSLMYIIHGK